MNLPSTAQILAHKSDAKNLVVLSRDGGRFYLTFSHIVYGRKIFGKKAARLKFVAEHELTAAQAMAALAKLTGNTASETEHQNRNFLLASASSEQSKAEILLLANAEVPEEEYSEPVAAPKPIISPYFNEKEVFLASQMTGAPNTR